jgi:hypothetical protein
MPTPTQSPRSTSCPAPAPASTPTPTTTPTNAKKTIIVYFKNHLFPLQLQLRFQLQLLLQPLLQLKFRFKSLLQFQLQAINPFVVWMSAPFVNFCARAIKVSSTINPSQRRAYSDTILIIVENTCL